MENTETFIRAKFQRMNLEVTFSNGEKGNEMTIIPEIDEGKRKTVDCVFYTRSGFCRNGESCRFTHSLKSQVDYYLGFGLGQNQVTKEKNPDVKGKSECRFYSTPQGCRNGNACRFAHEKTDVGERAPGYPRLLVQPGESGNLSAPQPLNVDSRGKIQANSDGTVPEQSLTVSARTQPYSPNANPYGPSEIPVGPVGLPLRPERPTCMFYRRYGLCKHGIGCQFNHPLNARRGNPASGRSSSNRSKSSTSTTKNGRK